MSNKELEFGTVIHWSENGYGFQSPRPMHRGVKAADVMRLSTAYGPSSGAMRFEQFIDSLSPSEYQTFESWWRGLSRSDQDCILAAIS
jgi:hypothetical protein